ncbi:MAG TPA: diaminopimelate decarboxylase, partial [Planctomycetaceae bacterium]|nr:diaminopimelate decarboxylase [Planctomycetaceae bacterium]
DHDALHLVVEHGIHVNCGSPDMISQLGEAAPGSEITLRINPGFGHGHSQKTNTGGPQSKHGIWHEQLEACLQQADRFGLAVTGIHMHIGSGCDFEHLSQVCHALEKMACQAGRRITSISTGGGLPIPYREDEPEMDIEEYFRLWDETRKRLEEAFGHSVRLETEPGRYLVAEAGYLVTEIRAVKEMGGNTFYLVDAGFHNLARPVLYGAYHPMSVCPVDSTRSTQLRPVIVGGPLCESGDIFTQREGGFLDPRPLPAAQVGDYLIIGGAGAYGFVMSSQYNSKPLAPEVWIEEGRPTLIRPRQRLEDLFASERIPGSQAG